MTPAILTAALLLATVPQETIPRDRVDLIEVNHFHDDQARLVFDQIIFYEWDAREGRHEVQAWRLLKSNNQRPQRDYTTGDYRAKWMDGETLREVRALAIRETWTNTDPELEARQTLAKERRRDLIRHDSLPRSVLVERRWTE